MKVYHKSIGFPEGLNLPEVLALEVSYTRHGLLRAKQYKVNRPKKLFFFKSSLLEVHVTKRGNISKLIFRTSYSKKKDIVYVIGFVLCGFKAKVVTLWLNDKKDKHFTLKKDKYSKP